MQRYMVLLVSVSVCYSALCTYVPYFCNFYIKNMLSNRKRNALFLLMPLPFITDERLSVAAERLYIVR